MKNLTPEQLSLHLSHGDWVAMKHKYGTWKVFMYEKPNGYFEGTLSKYSIAESLGSGLIENSYSPQEITKDFTEYQIIKRPPVLMKEGDKCQIIDSPDLRKLAEKERWPNVKKEMIGQKRLEVRSSDYYYNVFNKDKSNWFTFPYWAVARDFSEEEVEELTMEEVCQLLGREIKIKK